MKKLYEVVDLDVVRFDAEDILSTSGDPEPCSPDKLPICRTDDGTCPNNCTLMPCAHESPGLECPGHCNNK